MKKIILSIIAGLLAAAMIMSLTACSIDIHTGNGEDETVRIDLGDIDLEEVVSGIAEKVEEIDLEGIVSDISEGISDTVENIDLEEMGESLSESAEAFMGEVEEFVSENAEGISGLLSGILGAISENAGGSLEELGNMFSEGLMNGDSSDSQGGEGTGSFEIIVDDDDTDDTYEDITIEDIQEMDTDELLAYLKEALEANGMGAYYGLIESQIKSNPELIKGIIDQYLGAYLAD